MVVPATLLVPLLAGPVVNNVVQILFSLGKDEFLSVLGVKKDVEKLKSHLTAIQATLKDAEERQYNNRSLRDWLGKLIVVAHDAEDLLDEVATEASLWSRKSRYVRKIPRISYSQAVAKELKTITSRLKTISEEKIQFQLSVADNGGAASQSYDRNTSSYIQKDILGREEEKEKIIGMLQSDNSDEEGNISVIPIIGMAGLGKTTLAQLVYNDERVEECFELSRMWVCVPIPFNLTKILKDIMECYAKMPLPQNLSPNLILNRFIEFLPGKKFLLVLDDVSAEHCKPHLWSELINLLKLGKKGSKVLITSRSQTVADKFGTQPAICLEGLPEDECWLMFKRIAFRNGNLSVGLTKKLEDIGRGIVAKCNGLPFAIEQMGGVLCGNVNEDKWKRIRESNLWDLIDTDQTDILPALKLSYTEMPPYLKPCFAFCSIYPKAYVFSKKELVKLWMAESFVHSNGEPSSMEKRGGEYFDELLGRFFFQPLSNDKKEQYKEQYKMHDLVHDLAQWVSNSSFLQVQDSKSCSPNEHCRHVSLLCQNVEEVSMLIADKKKLRLRTLLLPSNHLKNFGQVPLKKLFDSLRYVRALDLSSSTLCILPSSIEKLKLLRYLDVSNTEIRELPDTVCNLYNLQTLKLLGCRWLSKLPNDLKNLVNLCNLEMDPMFWSKCHTLPPKIGSLKNLHNCQKLMVGCQTGYGINQLQDMANLTGTLHISNLENAVNAADAKLIEKEGLLKLVFEWSSRDVNAQDEAAEEMVLKDLQPHSNLKELQIIHYKGANFPTWIGNGGYQNLHTMNLYHCTKCKMLSISGLNRIQVLHIKGMLELDEWQDEECPSLGRLTVSDCPKLSKLPQMLFNLTVLKIKSCSAMEALPVTPSLRFLILVDNPNLENWNQKRFHCHCQDDEGQLQTWCRYSPFNLLELKIKNCPKMSTLPQDFYPQKLEISSCPLLTALPAPERAKRFQHLALDSCIDGTLVRAIPDSNSMYSLVISNITSLASLPKLPHLPGLKALYIHNCNDLISLSEEEEDSFQNLTSLMLLSIRGCQNITTLPNAGRLPTSLTCLSIGLCSNLQSLGCNETLTILTSLKDFYIEDCPKLQSFPDGGLPASLQHLSIKECPLLTERCRKEAGPEWPKIEHIPDLEINWNELPNVRAPSASWFRGFRRGGGENSSRKLLISTDQRE